LIIIEILLFDENFIEMEEWLKEEKYIEALPNLIKYPFFQPETRAYAYSVNNELEEAKKLGMELIKHNFRSIALFTLGLVFFKEEKYKESLFVYEFAVNVCDYDWYPIPLENLVDYISSVKIQNTKEITKIKNILKIKSRKPIRHDDRCYCGSHKRFKNCHGANFLKEISQYLQINE